MLLIAVLFGAIVNPEGVWSAGWQLIVFGTLLFAILAAIYKEGATRAFWIGFALFGWGYFSIEQLTFNHTQARFGPIIVARLKSSDRLNDYFTTRAKNALQRTLPPGSKFPVNQLGDDLTRLHYLLKNNLILLLLLFIATVGGVFGISLQKAQRKRRANEASGPGDAHG